MLSIGSHIYNHTSYKIVHPPPPSHWKIYSQNLMVYPSLNNWMYDNNINQIVLIDIYNHAQTFLVRT